VNTPVNTLCRSDQSLHPLEARRRECGFSRAALSEISGASASCIYQIERAGVQPTRSIKAVLSIALGVMPEELFPGEGSDA
jgi:DNA-binding XRE family transcriptional regulator